ncbi:MAG: hypothetical protein CVV64_00040 [Candidatus Wallbacteria bacterium HGW-Wallbacteria-1]|jgi:CheY-like chemotaxis protein|uniref:Response regulatory domain-containing protein n=1 Tax=Candidatus Wallbacteria bacterium HGW-Wallbacteria-1 TaxID=2013854 RepID=A0A2N1PU28_9BACT|nr:MAG: hypothetical protein CVV64_00040 [Candidatus Wallbacteria bacterium HGW-Wallbacteria-1]
MSHRIVWVEDNHFLQQIIINILKDSPFTPEFTTSASLTAWAAMTSGDRGGASIVVVDWHNEFSRGFAGFPAEGHHSSKFASNSTPVFLLISPECEDEASQLLQKGWIIGYEKFDNFFLGRKYTFLTNLTAGDKPREQKKILVIEGKPELREVLAAILSNLPNKWNLVKDGVSALMELEQAGRIEPYDVIICFQSIRDISPIEFFMLLKGQVDFYNVSYSLLEALGEEKLRFLPQVYSRSVRVLVSDDYEAQQAQEKGIISHFISKSDLFGDFSNFMDMVLG